MDIFHLWQTVSMKCIVSPTIKYTFSFPYMFVWCHNHDLKKWTEAAILEIIKLLRHNDSTQLDKTMPKRPARTRFDLKTIIWSTRTFCSIFQTIAKKSKKQFYTFFGTLIAALIPNFQLSRCYGVRGVRAFIQKWPLFWPVTFDLLTNDLDLWGVTRYYQDTSFV